MERRKKTGINAGEEENANAPANAMQIVVFIVTSCMLVIKFYRNNQTEVEI